MKISLSHSKILNLKHWLDSRDFRIFGFIIGSILLYWLLYGLISYFFAISVPLAGIIFVLAIHILIALGSILLIIRIRYRFLRLSSILAKDERIPIKELSEKLLIPPEKIRHAIMELKKAGVTDGVIDADRDVYLKFERWNVVRDLLVNQKKLSAEDLAKHLEISKTEAKFILLEMQTTKMVNGYFVEDNREFITRKWIYDIFKEALEKQGRINLSKTKQRLGMTDDAFWYELKNFIRTQNVRGFYFGEDEFVKFEGTYQDTFLEDIKNAGSISLKALSTKFNLPEEQCKYLITEYLIKGLLNGIFSGNGTSFITLDTLREHVILAIRQDGSLKPFVKTWGISPDVLYTALLRNFDFETLAERTGVTNNSLENILNQLLVETED